MLPQQQNDMRMAAPYFRAWTTPKQRYSGISRLTPRNAVICDVSQCTTLVHKLLTAQILSSLRAPVRRKLASSTFLRPEFQGSRGAPLHGIPLMG